MDRRVHFPFHYSWLDPGAARLMVFRVDEADSTDGANPSNALVDDVSGGKEERRKRRANGILAASFVTITLAAATVRALSLTSGLPYTTYVDEPSPLRAAAVVIANRTWQPGSYNYPPLTAYATAATSFVLNVLPGDSNVNAGAKATVNQPFPSSAVKHGSVRYGLIYSSDLIFAGRLVVLILSVGTVLLSALLALHLWGRRAGVIAALLTATIPALLTRSAIVIVDTPAAFFATACLLCAAYVRNARRPMLWALMGGASAGLAAAAKYPTAVVLLAVVTVIALSSESSLRHRLAMTCGALVAFAAAIAIAAPTLLFRTREVLDELRHQSSIYDGKAGTTYWHELLRGNEVGILLVVVALVGCIELLRSGRTRTTMLGFLVFAIAFVVPLARHPYQPFRNVLPLLPFLGVAASVAIVTGVDVLGRALHIARPARAGITLAMSLFLCGVMTASASRYYYDSRIDITDTRIQTREWLADRVGPDDDVLVADEVAFLPDELARIPGHVTVRSLTTVQDPIETAAFEYVVVGDFPSAENWRTTLSDRRIGVQDGISPTFTNPLSYRFNHQIIRVFEASGTRDIRECFPYCG